MTPDDRAEAPSTNPEAGQILLGIRIEARPMRLPRLKALSKDQKADEFTMIWTYGPQS